jgi:hypothetical protein
MCECEGNEGESASPEPSDTNEYREQQQPVQQRIRSSPNIGLEMEANGWDVVPPMVSRRNNSTVWNEVNESTGRMQYRKSLQHLGTFVVPDSFGTAADSSSRTSQDESLHPLLPPTSISTTPIVLADLPYLVAGCHDGTICFWNLMDLPALRAFHEYRQRCCLFTQSFSLKDCDVDTKLHRKEEIPSIQPDPLHCIDTLSSIPPLKVIDTSNLNAEVGKRNGIQITSSIVQLCPLPQSEVSLRKTFAAVNVLGIVYIVSASECILTVNASFETGRLSPTCITYCNDSIVIGYQSGFLEAWSLQMADDKEARTTAPAVKTIGTLHSNCSFSLIWRATFAECESAPSPAINAIVPLCTFVQTPKQYDKENKDATTTTDTDLSMETDRCCYLALTLHQDGLTRPAIASTVEVVDIASIANSWISLLDNNSNATSDNDFGVPLEEHLVLPESGREVVESSFIEQDESRHRPTTNWISSRGTNCLCAIPSDSSNRIAVGLADGMVAVLESSGHNDGQTQWGASPLIDHFCLSFPCIGMGSLNIVENLESPTPYLACCLRGSATYFFPLNSSLDSDDWVSTVLAASVPHSVDEDASIRYVQGFVAFNLVLKQQEEDISTDSKESIAMLVYVWPGGVIDVYSYGLLCYTHSLRREQLFQELISNGSVGKLRDVLLNSGGDDFELRDMWTDAMEEMRRRDMDAPIGISELESERLACFRKILLHFAH